jgi:hypothetical protein
MRIPLLALAIVTASALAGCGSDTPNTPANDAGMTTDTGTPPGDAGGTAQLPPMGREAVEAWLMTRVYTMWHCEPMQHTARSPSPHGRNRICTNDALSGHTGAGEYPVGAAAVKELYDDAGMNIVGYAVARHVAPGTTGATWYWYERVPANHPAPHDANGVVADGLGNAGPASTICVGCHAAAGSDAMHSGHDFVYTRVP